MTHCARPSNFVRRKGTRRKRCFWACNSLIDSTPRSSISSTSWSSQNTTSSVHSWQPSTQSPSVLHWIDLSPTCPRKSRCLWRCRSSTSWNLHSSRCWTSISTAWGPTSSLRGMQDWWIWTTKRKLLTRLLTYHVLPRPHQFFLSTSHPLLGQLPYSSHRTWSEDPLLPQKTLTTRCGAGSCNGSASLRESNWESVRNYCSKNSKDFSSKIYDVCLPRLLVIIN